MIIVSRTLYFVAVTLSLVSLAGFAAPPSSPPTGALAFCHVKDNCLELGFTEVAPVFTEQSTVEADGLVEEPIAGYPALPVQFVKLALPPGTALDTPEAEILELSFAADWACFDVCPVPFPRAADGQMDLSAETHCPDVYDHDALFPLNPLSLVETGHLGPYPFVVVKYYPFQYNPVQGLLRPVAQLSALIPFRRVDHLLRKAPDAHPPSHIINRAASAFLNFEQIEQAAKSGKSLPAEAEALAGYCIVTTNSIVASCACLSDFANHKRGLGFNAFIVTEDDFGGYEGDRALQIRSWLQDNYESLAIEYVLLIGDPTPDIGDVPMRMTYPRPAATWSLSTLMDWDAPTDYYYADLSGIWDRDGDGRYGEGLDVTNGMPEGGPDPVSFSVRYTGELLISEPGEKNFYLNSFGPSRLYIADLDTPLIEHTEDGLNKDDASITAEAGAYPIQVEYVALGNDGFVVLWYDDDDNHTYLRLRKSNVQHAEGTESVKGFWEEYFDEPDFTVPVLARGQTSSDFDHVWWYGDKGEGGMDSEPEVLVGRIPVYGDDFASLTSILNKSIEYECGIRFPSAERKTALLAMEPLDSVTPLYQLGEQMRTDFLENSGFGVTRVYEEVYELAPPPEYTPCTSTHVLSAWQSAPGLVAWGTHGSATRASDVFRSSLCQELDDQYPGFVFQGSCENGMPEVSNNLGAELLRHGAVATVSATRVAWYRLGQDIFRNDYEHTGGLTYHYMELIAAGTPCGEALYQIRRHGTLWNDRTCLMNAMVFNLYGEPALALTPKEYSANAGTLEVMLLPERCIDAGAAWCVDGGQWRGSGARVAGLVAGAHQVSFRSVDLWTAPGSVEKTVVAGEAVGLEGAYIRNTGTVLIDVTPEGAPWVFTDGDGQQHLGNGDGMETGIPTGNIELTWRFVADYERPSPNPVSKRLTQGGTITFRGKYHLKSNAGCFRATTLGGPSMRELVDHVGDMLLLGLAVFVMALARRHCSPCDKWGHSP